jgi:hypothetical protein
LVNQNAQRMMEAINNPPPEFIHGHFQALSSPNGTALVDFTGTFAISNVTMTLHVLKGKFICSALHCQPEDAQLLHRMLP